MQNGTQHNSILCRVQKSFQNIHAQSQCEHTIVQVSNTNQYQCTTTSVLTYVNYLDYMYMCVHVHVVIYNTVMYYRYSNSQFGSVLATLSTVCWF